MPRSGSGLCGVFQEGSVGLLKERQFRLRFTIAGTGVAIANAS